jgi:hypothetical protein
MKMGYLYMYADDTTIYVIGSDPDLVISALNKVLKNFTSGVVRMF